MKKLSSLTLYVSGLALVLTSAVLLAFPPTSVYAASCAASCQYGSTISVSGSTCSCTDNVGCTWTASDGKSYKQDCAKRTGGDEEELPEAQ
jgi:hypothetical protein